jgi:CO/xanthine dehydrogenase Mo-binding subunit
MATTAVESAPARQPYVGSSTRRVDAPAKLTGAATYAGDLRVGGLLHAGLVLSPHGAARIKGHDVSSALQVPGVECVLFAEDARNLAAPGAQVPLASGRVRFVGEPVAIVVARSDAAAVDGVAAVIVEYEPLPVVVDLFDAIREDSPRVLSADSESDDDTESHGAAVAGSAGGPSHPNIATETKVAVGDVEAALAGSAHVVKGRWKMAAVHQAPMETSVSIARPEPEGGMTIWTSTQAPFVVRGEVGAALGMEPNQVRVVSMTIGGGFGLKTSGHNELLASLAALAVGQPVRLQLTRSEQFQIAMSGECVAEIELGCDAEGRFTGARMDVWFDHGTRKGGYSRGAAVLLGGTYRLPAYSFHGRDVSTNKPPALAYRAPNAIAFYHLESAIDQLARKLDMDPIELRLKNASRGGDPSPIGQWPVFGMVECLEAARQHRILSKPVGPDEGIGVAAALWTGVGGPAFAGCLVEPDGGITLQVGYADLSGTDTSLAMIAADVLGMRPEQIRIEVGDTRSQPFSGQAGGSRTVYVIGSAVRAAAEDAKRQLLHLAADVLEVAPEDLRMEDGVVSVSGMHSRQVPVTELVQMSSQLFTKYDHGPIYGVGRLTINDAAPMATVHLCRVKVDRETGEWRMTEFGAVQDVGKVINRPEIEGQIHGGFLQSAGRALGEQMVFDADGTPRTTSFIDYAIPTIDQVPDLKVVLVEVPSPLGPLGARGVGEPPAIPAAPAIANALRRATGLPLPTLPVEAEEIALAGV